MEEQGIVPFQMEQPMSVNSETINLMDMELISFRMEKNILVNGKMANMLSSRVYKSVYNKYIELKMEYKSQTT